MASSAPDNSSTPENLTTGGSMSPCERDAFRQAIGAMRSSVSMARPWRAETNVGYLEKLAFAGPGWAWALGWIIDDQQPMRPVVVDLDGQRAGALAMAMMPRGDLPAGGTAFAALIRFDGHQKSDRLPRLILADGSGRYIEPVDGGASALDEMIEMLDRCFDARGSGPYDLLSALLSEDLAAGIGLNDPNDRLAIDDTAIVPDFGVFVSGWALSTVKEADYLALLIGDDIVLADPRSVIRRRRDDVAAVYPALGLATDRAGFTVLFRGAFPAASIAHASLRMTWSDGTRSHEPLPPDRARILGVTAPIADAQHFYPAIEAEEFFPDMAATVMLNEHRRASRITAFSTIDCDRCVILAVPTDTSDALLLFENIVRYAALLADGWGIALVAVASRSRSLIAERFRAVEQQTGRDVSLFFADGPVITRDVVLPICAALGADRAAYVAAHLSLLAPGWQSIGQTSGLSLLAMTDLSDGTTNASLDAAVGSVAHWREATTDETSEEATVPKPDATIADAGVTLGSPPLSPFEQRLREAARRHG